MNFQGHNLKLLLCVYSFSIKNCMIIAFSLNEIVQLQKHWIKCIKNWVFANKGIYIFHKIAHNKNCSRASHETHRRDKKQQELNIRGESQQGEKSFFSAIANAIKIQLHTAEWKKNSFIVKWNNIFYCNISTFTHTHRVKNTFPGDLMFVNWNNFLYWREHFLATHSEKTFLVKGH